MEAPLIVVSNRGPVSWEQDADGQWQSRRGAGGLIVALGDALQRHPGTWVSVALDEGDQQMAAAHDGATFSTDTGQGTFNLRLVDVGDAYDAYYNQVANRSLWFTLHQLWGEPYSPSGVGWRPGFADYLTVNESVAEAVIAEVAGTDSPEIHLQDYHLLAAAPTIRRAVPDARLLLYVHTPWVHPTYFRRLPDPVVRTLMDGLSACDVIGVSAPEWADGLAGCMTELGQSHVESTDIHGTWLRGMRGPTLVAQFVLGIDAAGLAAVAASDAARRQRDQLRQEVGNRTLIVRADRTDLSKNILRGFVAYDMLLRRRPELIDQLHFRALLKPSRQGVPEYKAYLDRCLELAEDIRSRFGPSVLAVDTSSSFPGVVAALQSYDVLLTNPVLDGTNLVAKEGPALNECDGVLVLSRTAGAAEAMDHALLVNPYDVEQTTDALESAVGMSASDRAARAAWLKEAAAQGSPAEWLDAQRDALAEAVRRR